MICLVLSSVTCVLVAMMELRMRFPHGISNSSIYCNSPSVIYISLHLVFGAIALILAENLALIKFDDNLPINLLKSVVAGLASTTILRISVSSVSEKGIPSTKIGPDASLDRIKSHLDNLIDNSQSEINLLNVSDIMNGVDP